MRFEVLRLRLLKSFGYLDGPGPRGTWPYFDAPLDPAEVKRQIHDLDAQLVWDGTKHVFKTPPPDPAAPPPQPPVPSPQSPPPPEESAEKRTARILADADSRLLAP